MSVNFWKLGRAAIFLAGSVVGGLALGFVLVLWRPELLPNWRPPATTAGEAPPGDPPPVMAANSVGSATESAASGATTPTAATQSGFAAAVRRAAPAVVNIYTDRIVTERVSSGLFEQFFGPQYQRRRQSSLGSGVIVDADGHILTNNHVVSGAQSIRIQLADGQQTEAKIAGLDPDTDLAVLQIDLKNLKPIPLGQSERIEVGDEVLAIGNPLGLSQTVTHGIVSATGRDRLGVATFERFIQTDAAINEGNSGGALVNASGELIGINTAVLAKNASSAGVEGIGFAIPVNLARSVMRELLERGRVVRGWIGIATQEMDDATARRYGLARGGVVVTDLYRNSPALGAGLRPGDILLSINGRAVQGAQDADSRIAELKPGGTVQLQLLRGAEEVSAQSQVSERPAQSAAQ